MTSMLMASAISLLILLKITVVKVFLLVMVHRDYIVNVTSVSGADLAYSSSRGSRQPLAT